MTLQRCGYPFRLATTSFIYPADYLTNVRLLAHRVDELELLFFESHSESLPSESQIGQLALAAAQAGITYNVHLPVDLDLAAEDPHAQKRAVRRMSDIIGLARPLAPTTHTLHLNFSIKSWQSRDIAAWQERAQQGVQDLLDRTRIDPQRLSIENLDYPARWLLPVVCQLGLSFCLDVGHVLRYGFDLEDTLGQLSQRITILHLHALADGKDHCALTRLDRYTWRVLLPFLTDFKGSVSIEVFSLENLDDSMISLAQRFMNA